MTLYRRLLLTLVGLFFLAVGSTFSVLVMSRTESRLPVLMVLPTVIIGATLCGRQSSALGITRSQRQIAVSPVGQFSFAAAILLPPFMYPIVALLVLVERKMLSSWLVRLQRLITMNVTGLVFSQLTDNGFHEHTLSNRQVIAVSTAIVVHVLVDLLIVNLSMSLIDQTPTSFRLQLLKKLILRDTAEVSIGAIGTIFVLMNPLLLPIVIAPCYLTVEYLRMNLSAQMGKRDIKTDLLNSLGLQEFVNHEFERAHRHSSNLCIIVLDLDHFRDVNTNYGHQVGDVAIAAVARQLASSTRTIDATARIGGEEFVIVLPNTDLAGAMTVAERIRHEVENLRFETSRGTLSVTISAGVALRNDGDLYADLFDRADSALYEAKRHGRNQVSMSKSSMIVSNPRTTTECKNTV